jgi:hypothetical protein
MLLPSMQEGAADKMDELVTLTEVGKELQKKKVTKILIRFVRFIRESAR